MQQICEPMPANVRSIWLMPNSDDEAFLSSLTRDLAERFGTPVFAPHLALRGGTVRAPHRLVEEIAAAASLVPLGKAASLPCGLDGPRAQLPRAQLLADAAHTGKPVAIEAVGR
jgi:hypothetical protein